MAASEIVILGGGVGGTLVANLLAHKLNHKQAQITLIDKTGIHAFQPGLLYVPFGGAPPEQLERAERGLLDRKVRLVVGDVTLINQELRQVEMADGVAFPFDYLVIATGARLAPEELPEFAEGAHHFYSAEAAIRLHATLRTFQGGRILVGVAALPYKSPPAPLEFMFMLDDYLRQHGLREASTLSYLTPTEHVFPIASIAEFVTPLLQERAITVEAGFSPARIDARAHSIVSTDGKALDYDLLVLVPPQRGAEVLITSELGDAQGWIHVDPETLELPADPTIYAIGDAANLPTAKTGSAAHWEAKVAAQRIAAGVLGEEDDCRYNGQVVFFLETGRNQATQLTLDYSHQPTPPAPSQLFHFEKVLFNRAYWHLVPNGLV